MQPLPVIVVDSREQLPWAFDATLATTVKRALPAGDYSLAGHEGEVAIERKSLDDLVQTVIHDWIRFRKELHRLAGYPMACVGVEANVEDVLGKRYKSDAHPNSILGRTDAILFDFGVPVFFWGSRPCAIHAATRFLLLAHKRLEREIA